MRAKDGAFSTTLCTASSPSALRYSTRSKASFSLLTFTACRLPQAKLSYPETRKEEVVDVLHEAGIAHKVVRMRPMGVVKG